MSGQHNKDEFTPSQAWQPVKDGSSDANQVYDQLRSSCPIAKNTIPDGTNIWYAFAAEDVTSILTNPETFRSSAKVKRFGMPLIPIETDQPEHTEYRSLFNKMLSPRRVLKFEQSVRHYVSEELDRLIPTGEFDIAPLTDAVPLHIFSMLLGEENLTFHEIDSQRRKERGESQLGELGGDAAERRRKSLEPLLNFCRERMEAVRKNPGENLATDITFGEINGRPLTDEEIISIFTFVYIAGHRTTTAGMQSAIVQLGKHSDAQEKLRHNHKMIAPAIEECLRLETPFHALPRHCAADTVIAGREIKKGDQVFPVYGAANVDPSAFENPGKFDIERKPMHFAFGRGIHMCAGAPLARMEIRILLEELLARCSNFEIVGTPERLDWPDNGFSKLVIKVTQ